MSESTYPLLVPETYITDLIRLSDGRLTPSVIADLMMEQLQDFFERTFPDQGTYWFGDRADEYAELYLAHLLPAHRVAQSGRPLIWKTVNVPHGSQVRMNYQYEDHIAEVRDGKIEDADGRFSPSEWASKVANGTSRNAWRDLSFKMPGVSGWESAMSLKERALKAFGEIDFEP